MAGGLQLAVRQIGSYPLATAAGPGDLVLVQPGGLGNPYAAITADTLVASALEGSVAPMGIGVETPGNAHSGLFTGQVTLPTAQPVFWNAYDAGNGVINSWSGAISGAFEFNSEGFSWSVGTVAPVTFSQVMGLDLAGNLALQYGTLSVARDPVGGLEVATAQWVGGNTVASFNGRRGVVTLSAADVLAAICADSPIATQNWVYAAIQAGQQNLLTSHPFVFGWNGRTGAVWLTLADISCVFFQPGQQPITQTPPLTSNDYSIPNTAWVVEYLANEFAGTGTTLATQAWVLANTVNSFNGRTGPVTLTSADVLDVGAAPLASPNFSGIPTAPTAAVGQATGQIATTAFVQAAITSNTAGVSTFNTRTGDVVLTSADISAASGLTNPGATLTGNPTCPTQPPGTNLPLIANCEFVQAAITAGTVTSFNTRSGAVTLTLADITGVGGAPLVSPAFSSVPTAPTAAPGTNTVQLATCAFVNAAVTASGGVSSFNSRTGAVTLQANDISAAGGLVNPSVGLTGSPTATTATAGDNSTRIATTAFVATALSSGAVSSFNTRTGAVVLTGADITAAGGALLASPALTGAPTAPTAAAGTNNTQIATTAYVTAAILADTSGVTSFNTRTGAISLLLADITGAGGAPLASPSFTGVPLGPTAAPGTSTTQLATTAFVQAALSASGVTSFNSRTGAITLIANDVSAAGGALVASPTFTGTPAAPTAAPGTNNTQLATTAFVTAALAASGSGYLPLSGGSLTGTLNIAVTGGPPSINVTAGPVNVQNLTANGGLTAAGGFTATTGANFTAGITTSGLTSSGGINITGGTFSAGAGSFSGTLTANGGINATGITTGSLTVSGGGLIQQGLTITPSGGGTVLSANPIQIVAAGILPTADDSFFCGNTGAAWYNCISYAFTNASDPRLKKDLATAPPGALLKVLGIPVRHFHWAREDESAPLHLGWDASEVQAAMPDATVVHVGDDDNGTLGLNALEMIAWLWQAVQELSAKVEALTP